jgi:hypothetical protein
MHAVHHCPVDHGNPGCAGRQHGSGVLDLRRRRREHLARDNDLVRVQAELA